MKKKNQKISNQLKIESLKDMINYLNSSLFENIIPNKNNTKEKNLKNN